MRGNQSASSLNSPTSEMSQRNVRKSREDLDDQGKKAETSKHINICAVLYSTWRSFQQETSTLTSPQSAQQHLDEINPGCKCCVTLRTATNLNCTNRCSRFSRLNHKMLNLLQLQSFFLLGDRRHDLRCRGRTRATSSCGSFLASLFLLFYHCHSLNMFTSPCYEFVVKYRIIIFHFNLIYLRTSVLLTDQFPLFFLPQ